MEPGPLLIAVQWLQGVVLGAVGTSIGIVAVASVGLMMMFGQIQVRRGMTVLLGCFILFGASAIANGLRNAVTLGLHNDVQPPQYSLDPGSTLTPVAAAPYSNGYDPYAGASVPSR